MSCPTLSRLALAAALLVPVALHAATPVDFKKQVKPVLEVYCLKCHGPEKPKGGLSLVTRAAAVKGGESGTSLTAGDPAKSPLFISTTLPKDDDKAMPPKGDRLTAAQQATLKTWIEQGAPWPDDIKLAQAERVDFVKQIQPIFEVNCVACHKEGHAKGDLRMDVKSEFFKSKDIVPGDAKASKVFTSTVLPADHDDLMPPKKKGGPLPQQQTDLIRDWIDQGAGWPDGVTLSQKEAAASTSRDETALYAALHALLVKNNPLPSGAKAENFSEPIPGTPAKFDMVTIPGGEFLMGSPVGEAGRKADEGPQKKVKISPFWMGKTEVGWAEYELFQFPAFEKGTNVSTERVNRELMMVLQFPAPADGGNPYTGKEADAVSRPTTPYVEMSFGMGKEGFPAISMTHMAALYYCRWLSAKTGTSTVSRPRPSGSTPRAPAPPRSISGATTPSRPPSTPGSSTTRTASTRRWARRSPTLGGCTTSSATWPSGRWTATRPTPMRPCPARTRGSRASPSIHTSPAADRGTTRSATCASRRASPATRPGRCATRSCRNPSGTSPTRSSSAGAWCAR